MRLSFGQLYFSSYDWPVHVADLIVKSQKWHWGLDGLTTLGAKSDNLKPSLVNLLSQLIHSDVTGSTHQHWAAGNRHRNVNGSSFKTGENKIDSIIKYLKTILPIALSGQVVDNSSRRDSLASTRRTLDQTERPLQHRLHSIHLVTQKYKVVGKKSTLKIKPSQNICLTAVRLVRSDLWVIEVRQTRGSEAFRELALYSNILHLVAQQFVVNVARHGGLVNSKRLQGTLHPEATQTQTSAIKKDLNISLHSWTNTTTK